MSRKASKKAKISKKSEKNKKPKFTSFTVVKTKRRMPKSVKIIFLIVTGIYLTIYLPPTLLEEEISTDLPSVELTSTANTKALQDAQEYIRNHPSSDFDDDGLTTEQEQNYNTVIYNIDSDFDGVTDYAELYLTETNPAIPDTAIEDFVAQSDKKTGNTVDTPFKVNDVVMWADDYASRARGGVIKLSDGSYNFYLYKGWVSFPENPEAAYKVVGGKQEALRKNSHGYFYIDDTKITNVRIYDEIPQRCYLLKIFGQSIILRDGIVGDILSIILPSKGRGVLICDQMLVCDTDGTWNEEVVKKNDIYTVDLPESYGESRFNRNEIRMTHLNKIYKYLDENKNVIISLMSHESGESILEVYGYTNRGNLLICDPATGEDFGAINITPVCERVLNKSGKIVNYERYRFSGCGYSSLDKHRIMLIDVIEKGVLNGGSDKDDKENGNSFAGVGNINTTDEIETIEEALDPNATQAADGQGAATPVQDTANTNTDAAAAANAATSDTQTILP